MDEEKVFRNFDWIRTTCEEDEQIRLSFPQYVMYKRHGKTFDCYCTACGRYFEMSEKDKGVNSEIKHWKQGQCPECEADVFFLCGSKVPAKTYYKRRHFVQFRAINGDLYVVAFNAYQIFGTGSFSEWNGISEYDTEYSYFDAQRYLYSSEGVFHWRYNGGWELLKSAHEPVFGGNSFSCYYDNSYAVLSIEEYRNSCMKYSGLAEYLDNHVYDEFGNTTRRVLAFLTTMKKYPDLEKVIKSGFENVVYNCITPEGIKENGVLNLRGKNTQAILGLDRQEMKRLGSGMISVDGLKHWKAFRAVKVNGGIYERDLAYHRFGMYDDSVELIISIAERTGLSHQKVMNYVERQAKGKEDFPADYHNILIDWKDYLGQCVRLRYDTKDTVVCKPKNLHAAHERLSKIIKEEADRESAERFRIGIKWRKALEFESGELIVIQPKEIQDIIEEGRTLHHCVGGYANRHAAGELTIMFLRKKDEPDTPYYTIEVSNELKIVQCRGYRNNNAGNKKTQDIINFENEYQKYLKSVDLKNMLKKLKKGA